MLIQNTWKILKMASCAVEGGCVTDYVAIVISILSMIMYVFFCFFLYTFFYTLLGVEVWNSRAVYQFDYMSQWISVKAKYWKFYGPRFWSDLVIVDPLVVSLFCCCRLLSRLILPFLVHKVPRTKNSGFWIPVIQVFASFNLLLSIAVHCGFLFFFLSLTILLMTLYPRSWCNRATDLLSM